MTLLDRFVERYGRLPTEFDPDYLEMLRMSKYRVVPVPDVQPGKCANCGSSKCDGRSYIDIGLDIAWYGALFLCSLCLEDISRHVGLFDKLEQRIAELDKKLDTQEVLNSQGRRLREALKDTMEEVREYLDNAGLGPDGDNLTSGGRSGMESSKESSKSAAGESNRSSKSTEQRTTKSSSSSGPKDLLSLAERLKAGA